MRAAEVVAAADDDGHLRAVPDHVGDLGGDGRDDIGVDAEALPAGEGLAGELQQHPVPAALGRLGPGVDRPLERRLNGAGLS